MLLKISCIVFLINTLVLYSKAIPFSERNQTILILSLKSQFSELRAEQERYFKLTDGLLKALDIQAFKTELERQGKLISGLGNSTDIILLKMELELQGKRMDGLAKEQEQQKSVLNNKGDIQSLREEQERQGKLIDRLVKELDKHSSRFSPQSCTSAKISGIYEISVQNFSKPFKVACDAQTRGGEWTIILRRMDGSVDFFNNWNSYKNGFGDLNGEFFLGLDKIHALTADRTQELLVVLQDFEGDERFETYDEFAIGNEDEKYILHKLGKANGTAGDSLSYHRGMKFTTFDRDNDRDSSRNCAATFTGAWWYDQCFHSNLAGKYNDDDFGKGINWRKFRGVSYSLKRAVMMIRPRK